MKSQNGLEYELLDLSTDSVSPRQGDYITMYISYRKENDSVFYESVQFKNNKVDRHYLEKVEPGSFEEVLCELKRGDSANVYIQADNFFRHYIEADIPDFIEADEQLCITLRLLKVQDIHEYYYDLAEEIVLMEQKEQGVIQRFLSTQGERFKEHHGTWIYRCDSVDQSLPIIQYGDLIRVNYEARFLENNNLFYSTYRNGFADEYTYGVPGQMIEGMQLGLSGSRIGDSLIIVVPSDLGFKDQPSAGGIVPAYCPLKYTVRIEELVVPDSSVVRGEK